MIELSLDALIDNFPASRAAMPIHADRFNELFRYRWDRIVEFLKLHYVLSRRTEPYWLAQRDSAHVPPRLAEMLALWRDQPPSAWDRSEEHTSELQSLMRISYAVFCLKKKKTITYLYKQSLS